MPTCRPASPPISAPRFPRACSSTSISARTSPAARSAGKVLPATAGLRLTADPAHDSFGILRRGVAGKGDKLVRPDEDELRLEFLAPACAAVAHDCQRYASNVSRTFIALDVLGCCIQRQQREAAAQHLEYVAPRRQRLRREMMPGTCLERMIAVRARRPARQPHADGRSLVDRLVADDAL